MGGAGEGGPLESSLSRKMQQPSCSRASEAPRMRMRMRMRRRRRMIYAQLRPSHGPSLGSHCGIADAQVFPSPRRGHARLAGPVELKDDGATKHSHGLPHGRLSGHAGQQRRHGAHAALPAQVLPRIVPEQIHCSRATSPPSIALLLPLPPGQE